MALMTERGFQEEGEAAGKWRRARSPRPSSPPISSATPRSPTWSPTCALRSPDGASGNCTTQCSHTARHRPAAPRGRLAAGSAAALPGEQISEEVRVACGDLEDLHAA